MGNDAPELEIVQGTLDTLVLKALSWRRMHGYNILSWLRNQTDGALGIEGAALYPALHRLKARKLIASEWGLSENNRKARYYSITPAGAEALRANTAAWRSYVVLMAKVLDASSKPPAPENAS